ncbi:hypothetical protein AAFP30_11840 [Gordonia sp. CPCC 205515]|uniref:hypothetical protein n=1 Tax=Gordonia sp. CPCC 205515 TaxID=3140791 RepID=UPI003AF3730A
MAQYRVIDSRGDVVAEKEFTDSPSAYDWFKTEQAPSDELGMAMQVWEGDEWKNFDITDGGTNPGPADDA